MPTKPPTLGDHVLYTLTEADCDAIEAKHPRYLGNRNAVHFGDVLAAIVVRVVDGRTVNLQVLTDGEPRYWATSRTEGTGPGHWVRR